MRYVPGNGICTKVITLHITLVYLTRVHSSIATSIVLEPSLGGGRDKVSTVDFGRMR